MARSCGGPCPAMQSSVCMIVMVHMVQGLRPAAHFTIVAPIRLCPWAYLFCLSWPTGLQEAKGLLPQENQVLLGSVQSCGGHKGWRAGPGCAYPQGGGGGIWRTQRPQAKPPTHQNQKIFLQGTMKF